MSRRNAELQRTFDFEQTIEGEKKPVGILIVEDDPNMREFMRASLEREGFNVITAANGLEGVRRYKENRDLIQLVVTDLDMPTMNGSDMIRQLFKIAPAIKVIVASGHPVSEHGAPCLQKPYTARELRDAVQALL